MKKLSIDFVFYIALILFPVGTLIFEVPVIGSIINKVLIAIILLGVFWFCRRCSRKTAMVLISIVSLVGIDVVFTELPFYNFNEVFYLLIWVLYLNCFGDNWDEWFNGFYNYKKLMFYSICLWNIIVMITFFVPACYTEGVFGSLAGGPHRLASSAVLIMAFVGFLYKKEKQKGLMMWLVVPMIAILLSGARTYIGVMLGLLVLVLYQTIQKKYLFWISIIPFMVVCCIMIWNTDIVQNRMTFSDFILDNYGYMGALTSGRSIFWKIDVQQFFKSSAFHQILGNGFNFIRQTNEKYYNNPIWAHNDFINILGCNGYVGLFLYFQSYTRAFGVRKKIGKGDHWIKYVLFHFICMLNACFNMLYTYQSATLAIPFLIYFIYSDESGSIIKNESLHRKKKIEWKRKAVTK